MRSQRAWGDIMIYDSSGSIIPSVYTAHGDVLSQAYDISGNALVDSVIEDVAYDSAHSSSNLYAGGLIEIQPDSWDGLTVVTGEIVQPSDPTAWGFPMSLSRTSKALIKSDLLGGNGAGISFIRFPMGFAYRGYRNVDATTGLAKNIGQRWDGQNAELGTWFANIVQSGGGLDVEYWCLAPYWLTGGAYYNADVNNEVWAGGTYPRSTTLSSIKSTDATQYAAQIDALTDAIVDDFEYLHQNVAPVRMYTLAAEPTGSGKQKYGHCHWTSDVYNDIFAALHPKVMASTILATYHGKPNAVLMHLCANDAGFGIGTPTINDHSLWIWGYSHDVMRAPSGESGVGADIIKDLTFPSYSNSAWENVFICEYEYFGSSKTNDFRCANNIVRMILELACRKAKIVMPVIHICKPTGQASSQTNTAGYCLYAVDMSDGSYATNPWAYNSWKMISDNLPIGAEFYQGGDGGISYAGYAIFKKDGKTFLLMGNYASVNASFTVTFNQSHSFTGKKYSINSIGTTLTNKSGSAATFDIPAYSGCVYVCDDDVTVSSVVGQNDLDWEAGYINDNGVLTGNIGSYVAKAYTPASGAITVTTTDNTESIRIAEYDSSKNFVRQDYVTGQTGAFTLDASTSYIRVGFKYASMQSEETVTALFDGGYTIA